MAFSSSLRTEEDSHWEQLCHSELRPVSVGTALSCSHCGKEDVVLKICGKCKQVAYCGAECHKTAWKTGHKQECGEPFCIGEVLAKAFAADHESDWPGVLKWKGRMEWLMEGCTEKAMLKRGRPLCRSVGSLVVADSPDRNAAHYRLNNL